MFNKNIIIKFI